jgi:ABC-type nickel/cobalt efflux system permease component RcnA
METLARLAESGIVFGLVSAFILGVLHGLTPDEHTWPITFSYSVGSYSSRKGALVGLRFSGAFTLQRAIASELAYLGFSALFAKDIGWNFKLYILIGVVMVLSGFYLRHLQGHLVKVRQRDEDHVPSFLPFLHGFIAGWGFGAYAIVIYTIVAPHMPGVAWGWIPGFLFGIGTTVSQILFGAGVGLWMQRQGLTENAKAYIAKNTGTLTLIGAGILFVIAGIVGIANPTVVNNFGIPTHIPVWNLDAIDVGFLLAVPGVFIPAVLAFAYSFRKAKLIYNQD